MGALPNVPQVLKVQLIWGSDSDIHAQTVHHFQYSGGPPSGSDCGTMCSEFVTAAESAFQALMPAASGMKSAIITDLTTATSAQGEGGTPWAGTNSSAPVPPGAAVVVSHQIGRRYRGGKPRSYLPIGAASSLSTSGLWLTAAVTAFDTAWGNFVASMIGTGSGCTLSHIVNVSYYSGFTVVTSPTTGRARNVPKVRATPLVDLITGHTTSAIVGSQRRRNRAA